MLLWSFHQGSQFHPKNEKLFLGSVAFLNERQDAQLCEGVCGMLNFIKVWEFYGVECQRGWKIHKRPMLRIFLQAPPSEAFFLRAALGPPIKGMC
jgi:hypothetical protein